MTFAANALRLMTALATSLAPISGYAADQERYFFRHKTIVDHVSAPVEQTKDINAFFAGGVGVPFDQRLPMRADWDDDTWNVTSGTLPAGLSFDPATLSFKGTPTLATSNAVVTLEGFDQLGRRVATAKATFDVYGIEGALLKPEFYAHTGQYKFDQLPVPAGKTIDSWSKVLRIPDGITVNGRNFEGTPTKAGVYPIALRGLDYLGNVVATYIGTYIVEDGPTFAYIPDKVAKLPQTGELQVGFGAPSTDKVRYAIKGADKVRYFLEIAAKDALPGNVSSNDIPSNLRISGNISEPYQTASVRYRAVDVDNTKGYSNWFRVGTTDPQPTCTSSPAARFNWKTGVAVDTWIPGPAGAQGTLSYEIVSGEFPPPLKFDTVSGTIKGLPTATAAERNVIVRVNVTNGADVVSTECNYIASVTTGDLALVPRTSAQGQHIRLGQTFTGSMEVLGGIPSYSVTFKEPATYPDLTFSTPTTNTPLVGVTGTVPTAGTHSVALKVSNGDGNEQEGFLTIKAHAPLAMPAPTDVVIKRYAAPNNWGNIAYDATTIVPDLVNGTIQPSLTLNGPALPQDITFGALQGFQGATSAAKGTFGPYTVTLSDYTGETLRSQPFNVVVQERDDMLVDTLTPPSFRANFGTVTKATLLTVTQPYGASALDIDYELSGPSLPTGISFDGETGEMIGLGDIAYEDIGTYGPYTITATDEEGFNVTSDAFELRVTDIDNPASVPVPVTTSNLTGNQAEGELPTYATTPPLKPYIVDGSVYGGRDSVSFVSADPATPAGLTFNQTDGTLSGEPTSEFDGTVNVTFKDTKGRQGVASVPLKVLPYPKVSIPAVDFDIARLAEAKGIAPSIVHGFRGSPTWSLHDGQLPQGLSVDSLSGEIKGVTNVAAGTDISGLRLKAVDSASGLPAFTTTFAIHVKDRSNLSLNYTITGGTELTYKLAPDATTDGAPYTYVSGPGPAYTVSVGGSYVSPLVYSISAMPDNLSGIGINAANGRLTGNPSTLGSWTIPVSVVDAEGSSARGEVAIRSTIDGYIVATNGENTSKTLRVGEPLRIPDDIGGIATKNKVGTVIFSTAPAILPDGLVFDPVIGSITDESVATSVGLSTIVVGATDAHGRTFQNGLTYRLLVKDKLDLQMATTSFTAKQYTTALDIDVPAPNNAIDDITYAISGDVPGTLVLANYNASGEFVDYSWEATPGNVVHSVSADALALDAIVFDPLAGTIKGTPSKTGTYPVTVTAYDSHMNNYLRSTGDRIANNSKSITLTLDVAPAEALAVSSNANSENLTRYTSTPTLVSTVANAAYGKGVVWTPVTGSLPTGLSDVKGASSLSYSGYPQATGTWTDIRYRATDAAGRHIETSAAAFTVGNRKPLVLNGPEVSYFEVNKPAANIVVTASEFANGIDIPASDWSLSGVSKLPEGMSAVAANGTVTISGTPTKIGEFTGFTISATDSKGGTANLAMQFVVLSPGDEIDLQVAAITSKPNIPFTMTPTTANTYGAKVFSSPEIEGAFAGSMSLDRANGTITGTFPTVGSRPVILTVSDATKRLTSKPVPVNIIPNLRVLVPSVLQLEQYAAVNRTIDTDYQIGTVSYAKGNPQAWPESLTVDANSGAITGQVNKTGTVTGLYITAKDTFSGNVDTQNSNTFDIVTTKSNVEPDIADITGMKLYTATSPITPIASAVKEKVSGKTWAYGGLKFTLNGTLPQGLNFDSTTGTISGTPAEPSYTEQLSITVEDEDGNKDTTTTFDIAVRDVFAKLPVFGDYEPLVTRIGAPFTVQPATIVGKPSGRVTYTIVQSTATGLSVNAQTGVVSGPATGGSDGITYILAKDQSGYELRYQGRATILNVQMKTATLVYPSFSVVSSDTVTVVPTSTHVLTPAVYSLNKALPSGMSINAATGAITGTTAEIGTDTGFVVTATDAAGTVVSNSFSIVKNTTMQYRWVVTNWVRHHTYPYCVALAEFRVKSGTEDITSVSLVSASNSYPGYPSSNLTDGIITQNINKLWVNDYSANKEKAIYFTPPAGKSVTSLVLTMRQDGAPDCSPTAFTVQRSSDGVNWADVWSNTITQFATGMTYTAMP
ncbi:Ig domain-containing protein [Agrobacterium salinitolerans]|nr:Ig domain-containing protein [Agrobacterium salinitolerans]